MSSISSEQQDWELHVQEEVEYLRGALDSARLEISPLKAKVAVLTEGTMFLNSKMVFVQPSVEVLRMIFSWALPPSFLVDPSLAAGPQSPWSRALRLKKSIVQVCRLWQAAGTGFLYEEVVFRRIGQIPAFIRTLESLPEVFGNLVKKITISAHIPRRYGRSCSEQLQNILRLCPRVHQFALASPTALPDNFSTLRIGQLHITALEFNDAVDYSSLLPILTQVCDGLLSLSFYPTKSDKMDTAICFPQLKNLVCNIWQSEADWQALTDAWSMPSLECLTLSTGSSLLSICHNTVDSGMVHLFCMAHGRRLRFLLIGPGRLSHDSNVQKIVDACPRLEHLVLRLDRPLHISHRYIKWIDLWPSENPRHHAHFYPWEKAVGRNWAKLKDTVKLPALQGTRTLMHGLPGSIVDIPMLIPPGWAAEKQTFSIQYHGIDIRFQRGFLYNSTPVGKDGIYASGFDNDYLGIVSSSHDTDDENYVPGSEASDSSSCGSDIDSCSSDDELYLPEFSDSDAGAPESDSDSDG